MRRGLIACLALLAQVAGAADGRSAGGWYLGGGAALTNVFANKDIGLYGSSERGSSDTGFVISGGYRFARYVAAEIGWLDGGEPRFDSLELQANNPIDLVATNIAQKTDALEASVLGILPFFEIWEVYIKGGFAFWDATSRQVLTPVVGEPTLRQLDRDGTDFLLGIGVGFSFTKNLHLRLEYQAFRTNDELLALTDDREARFDSFAAELHWRFGNRR